MRYPAYMVLTAFVLVLSLAAGWLGCEERPTTPSDAPYSTPDTAYVQLSPPFGGFNGPQDVFIGNDQLLYVADTRANRLVMMTRAGAELSERTIIHPISIAQDSKLDLLVGGETVASNGDTVGSILRIHLVDAAHHLEQARVEVIWRELERPHRRFPGIVVFGDNSYLVARTGNDNSSFIDPDGRVMQFDRNDRFVTPVPALTTEVGSGLTDIYKPTGIAGFPKKRDFVLCQSSEGIAYGAIWMKYESSSDFDGWLPQYDPANIQQRNVDFISVTGRYLQPEAVTVDKSRGDVFVADAGLDSVFKFNARGAFKVESFGKGRTKGAMKHPTGLSFFEGVLYVADDSTGQVLRFRLASDIPR